MRGKAPLRIRLLVVAVLFPIAGAVILGLSWKEWRIHSHLEKAGIQTTGTVQSSERVTSKRSSSYRMVVSYKALDRLLQGEFRAKSKVGEQYPVGSQIEVVYDSKDASVARLRQSLDSGEHQLLTLLSVGMLAAGSICAVVGLGMRK